MRWLIARSMLNKCLYLTWRKLLAILAAWVLSVVLHNVVYGLFRDRFGPDGDEPVFFLIAVVVIPVYLLVSLVYTVFSLAAKRRQGLEQVDVPNDSVRSHPRP